MIGYIETCQGLHDTPNAAHFVVFILALAENWPWKNCPFVAVKLNELKEPTFRCHLLTHLFSWYNLLLKKWVEQKSLCAFSQVFLQILLKNKISIQLPNNPTVVVVFQHIWKASAALNLKNESVFCKVCHEHLLSHYGCQCRSVQNCYTQDLGEGERCILDRIHSSESSDWMMLYNLTRSLDVQALI